jgi:hypothetical protein
MSVKSTKITNAVEMIDECIAVFDMYVIEIRNVTELQCTRGFGDSMNLIHSRTESFTD